MPDFVPEPRDRLEAPICNAIESRDFKQALKLVEKRLAKNSDTYLQALKYFILCNHPLGTERGKALEMILDLSRLSEGRLSTAELDLYDEGLRVQFLNRQGVEATAICKMRADAVKAAPKDEQLARACFRACFRRDNLEYSQQTSSTCPSQKAQIYSRLAYTKIKILATSTLETTGAPSTRSLQSPQELLLFYRLLEAHGNTAEITKFSEYEMLGPTAKIAKGDWAFRRKSLQLMERREEWQGLFYSSRVLLTMSRADQDGRIKDTRGADWTVWKAFLKAASELKSQYARDVVATELSSHLDPKSGLDKTYRRNAWLADLESQFLLLPSTVVSMAPTWDNNAGKLPERVLSLCLYLNQYGQNASAFDDIKDYVGALRSTEQKALLAALPLFMKHQLDGKDHGGEARNGPLYFDGQYIGNQAGRLLANGDRPPWHDIKYGITKSKLSYLLQSSMAEKSRRSVLRRTSGLILKCDWCYEPCGTFCHSCIKRLAGATLQAYRWALTDGEDIAKNLKPTDKHPADEWAIIAAICQTKLAVSRPLETEFLDGELSRFDIQHLLRAIVVLEYSHTHSKANPQISLLLVRLYALIGAGSLAMRAYHRLGVKQIQGDTLGYVLFDRISSLHPHIATDEGSGSSELLDPTKHLKKLQRLYRSFGNQIAANSWKSFEQESYDSVFQLIEVSEVLSKSLASAMFAVELRQIDRLTKPDQYQDRNSYGYDVLPLNPAAVDYVDNFDHSSFPNYEDSGQASFESCIRIGPSPSNVRTKAFLLLEELWMAALNTTNPAVKENPSYIHLKNLTYETNKLSETLLEQGEKVEPFTLAENHLVNVGLLLINLINKVCATDKEDRGAVSGSVLTLCAAISQRMADATAMLEDNIGEHQTHDWVPMFVTTLHPLYVAREAASLVIAVADCTLRLAFQTPAGVKSPIEKMKEEAIEIRKLVSKKSTMVKRRVDHGRWLDFVLDHVQFENLEKRSPGNESKTTAGEEPKMFGNLLVESISAEFLEQWAGELVESWRDSVTGLNYLKSD